MSNGQENVTALGTALSNANLSSTPSTSSTPAETSAPSKPVETATIDTSTGAADTPTEWSPDFSKLRIMDKEFDWDEDIKKAVTKENYEKLKDFHNKAYGLPFVKE